MSNGTVHSGYTDRAQATARLVIVLVSRIQKSGTGDKRFVKWQGTFRSDRPTEMTRPVKVDHLQRWSQIFRSDGTEMVRSISFLTEKFQNFELNEKRPVIRLQRRNLKGINLLTTIQYAHLTNKDFLHFNFHGHVKEKRLRVFLKKTCQ